MAETKHHEDVSDANAVKLVLAWSFVGIPACLGCLQDPRQRGALFQ